MGVRGVWKGEKKREREMVCLMHVLDIAASEGGYFGAAGKRYATMLELFSSKI